MRELYKTKKIGYTLYVLFLSFMVSFSMGLQIGNVHLGKKANTNLINLWFRRYSASFKNIGTNDALTLILITIVIFYLARREYSKRCKHFAVFFATISSALLLLARSFYMNNSLGNLFGSTFLLSKTIIIFIGYSILLYFLTCAFIEYFLPRLLESDTIKNYHPKKFKVTLGSCFAAILIAWFPIVVITYPCNFCNDTRDEIAQFVGNAKVSKTDTSIVYPEGATTLLNNHHPIAFTMLIGTFYKLGKAIGNVNLGMFCLTMIQMLILAWIYSYSIQYLKSLGVPTIFQLVTLAFFMFFPVIQMFALTITKDSLYGGFMILVTIQFFKMVRSEDEFFSSKKELWLLFVSCLGLMLLRNNGLYILFAAFAILFIRNIKNVQRLKALFLSIGVPIFLYWIVLLKIILPLFHIPNGSPREMLSIPFQQVARYAKVHGEAGFKEGEIEILDKILCFDGDVAVLADRYQADISDPVKNKFNRYYTKQELSDFMGVWLKLVLRDPVTCITATLNNVYYYFSIDYKKLVVYKGVPDGFYFGLKHPSITKPLVRGYQEFCLMLNNSSMLGWAFSVGPWNYMFVICLLYMAYKKAYRYILMTLPVVLNFLIGLAGPVAYMRYAIEWIVVLPLFAGMVWLCLKESTPEKCTL